MSHKSASTSLSTARTSHFRHRMLSPSFAPQHRELYLSHKEALSEKDLSLAGAATLHSVLQALKRFF